MGDLKRPNTDKILISNNGLLAINAALLKNPFLTRTKIKNDLQLIASNSTIGRAIQKLGWRKVRTQYCQIVSPTNRIKRFIYCCLSKLYQDNYDDTIDADETSVEVRYCSNTNYQKPSVGLLRPAGGKLGKPKHNDKVHLFGGISRHGLTPLVIFTGIMFSKDYQNMLSDSILPFIRQKLPYHHKFYMDNDPKHTSDSTTRFIILNNINHFETPPQSPDLMPIEMVLKIIIYSFKIMKYIYSIILGLE